MRLPSIVSIAIAAIKELLRGRTPRILISGFSPGRIAAHSSADMCGGKWTPCRRSENHPVGVAMRVGGGNVRMSRDFGQVVRIKPVHVVTPLTGCL